MAKKKAPSAAEAFLQAICAEPDEDAHRLVYADWLDDHGQPERAEFIRVQCALAKLDDDDPRRLDLAPRERELFDEHRRAWLNELPRWARPNAGDVGRYRRGFLAVLDCTARQWLKGAGALLRRVPVECLSVAVPDGVMAAFCGSPHLARLPALWMSWLRGPAEAALLAAAPHLDRLTELAFLVCDLGDGGLAALAQAPFLARLRRLYLSRADLSDAAARLLGETAALAGLRELDLSYNRLGADGAAALAASPHLGGVERLDLTGCPLGDAGAVALAGSPHLSRLRELSLSGEGLSGQARQALRERFGDKVCL
jgi:uncharacterized protein (TIGR02996 family)